MLDRIKKILSEKKHIIVVTIISIYLLALTVKTAHLYYTEYWLKKEPAGQTQNKNSQD